MLTKAFIPYKGYYSTPFCRWQGSLANENSIVLGSSTSKRWLETKGWDPKMFDYLFLGITIGQHHWFYGSTWATAMMGATNIPGVTISQACTTSTTCIYNAAMGVETGLYKNCYALMTDRCSNGPHTVWPNPTGPGGEVISENWLMDNFRGDPNVGLQMIETAENVATESARITIWMAATEKMSEKLKQATQLFEDSKQRIDRVNELVEYIESKTNVFAKQKELLKNAHIEAGKANAIFWEIKSKHSELERDVEKIKKMETHVLKFDSKLKSIENRISRLDINIRKLIPLSEKIDKTDKEVNALTDKLDHLDQRMRDSRKYAESIAGECNDIRKSQENIRLDVSEIIDQFGKLSDLRIFTEEKTRALRKYFEWAEEKLSELGDVSKKTSPKIQAGMRNR